MDQLINRQRFGLVFDLCDQSICLIVDVVAVSAKRSCWLYPAAATNKYSYPKLKVSSRPAAASSLVSGGVYSERAALSGGALCAHNAHRLGVIWPKLTTSERPSKTATTTTTSRRRHHDNKQKQCRCCCCCSLKWAARRNCVSHNELPFLCLHTVFSCVSSPAHRGELPPPLAHTTAASSQGRLARGLAALCAPGERRAENWSPDWTEAASNISARQIAASPFRVRKIAQSQHRGRKFAASALYCTFDISMATFFVQHNNHMFVAITSFKFN